MSGAKKIAAGEYAYRGYELAKDRDGWHIRKEGMSYYPWRDCESKKAAMIFIDDLIDQEVDRKARAGQEDMSDTTLMNADPWAWLDK